MKFYPINLNLKDKNVLIVGAGKVALRKFKRLIKTTAKIKVVSPSFNQGFNTYLNQKSDKYKFLKRKFRAEDVANQYLIFAATNKKSLNKKIAYLAKKNKALVNTVDNSAASDFTVPALVKRGDLTLTISSGANLPALSRNIRKKLENEFGIEYSFLLEAMAEKRLEIISEIKNDKLRKKIFRELASNDFLTKIRKIISEYKLELLNNNNLELTKPENKQISEAINKEISQSIIETKENFNNNF